MNPALIGIVAGLLKSALEEPGRQRQNTLAAKTAEYAPWTKMTPGPVQQPQGMNNVMQGGMAGLSYGQNAEQSDLWNNYIKSQMAKPAAAESPALSQLDVTGYNPMPLGNGNPQNNYWNQLAQNRRGV